MSTRSEGQRLVFSGHDGLEIVAEAWGAPTDRGVLFAHGGGQTRHSWGGAAQRLAAEGWYAMSMDLRGHGESAWCDEQNYSMEAFSGDLRIVAESFASPPAVVGASLGGIASLIAAGEMEPVPFRALVLVDITPKMAPAGVDRIVGFMLDKVKEGFASLEEAAEAVAAYQPHRKPTTNYEGLRKNLRLGDDGRYRWHWDPAFLTGATPPKAANSPDRLEEAARALSLPTMLVRGRMSDLVTVEAAEHFLELAPHARFVDVSGAGHMVAGDRNDIFSDAVIEFLSDVEG